MADIPVKAVEKKIDELIQLCEQLNRENQALKANASSWQQERESLLEKTNLARNKVESMIQRLRALEQES
ncbi:MAG TPA: TIGR02449 family protein [Spongiibacteraceae bacterium]|nr:TIGR02449 family protein [Spongiibacteraceae bacterium]HCS27945.1 TIGR02449 family protein [Spongiibacteraceae bacterium]|tara:strand:- start:261 stop:470 length:210 start_codon:yes stop_codon:yes gene_type:complete